MKKSTLNARAPRGTRVCVFAVRESRRRVVAAQKSGLRGAATRVATPPPRSVFMDAGMDPEGVGHPHRRVPLFPRPRSPRSVRGRHRRGRQAPDADQVVGDARGARGRRRGLYGQNEHADARSLPRRRTGRVRRRRRRGGPRRGGRARSALGASVGHGDCERGHGLPGRCQRRRRSLRVAREGQRLPNRGRSRPARGNRPF